MVEFWAILIYAQQMTDFLVCYVDNTCMKLVAWCK